MLYTSAAKTQNFHRRQNSSPMNMDSVMRAPLAPTNHQPIAHRRGQSMDQARHSQDFDHHHHHQDCGKISTNNNGPSIQQPLRAAQMPATSRPGHYNNYIFPGHMSHPLIFPPTDSDHMDQLLLRSNAPNGAPQYNQMRIANTMSHLVEEVGKLPSQNIKQVFEELGLRYEIANQHEGNEAFGILSDDLKIVNDTGARLVEQKHPYIPMKRGTSWQEPIKMEREMSGDRAILTAPNSAPLRSTATFEAIDFGAPGFMDITDLKYDLAAVDRSLSSSNHSPVSHRSGMSSFQSSPELGPISLFGTASYEGTGQSGSSLQGALFPSVSDAAGSKRKGAGSKKGSSAKQASDEELNFNPNDFLVESTITEEEINAHIQGPEENGKYVCLYENCKNAPFGRKENIRAHVQTHLDDRRYKCDACNNKFVRPNDLKRHWQIHINKRDFKCFCGAAFNRHDALKRHRERSEWCESGGTRGSPDSPKKDEKKRGRPKKIAPTESQERRERKAQIRREIRQKQEASAASSVASSQPSPPAFFDFGDCQTSQTDASGLSPTHLLLSPPTSPRHAADEVWSPVAPSPSHTTRRSISPPPTRDSMISFGVTDTGSIDTFLLRDPEPALGLAASSSVGNSSRHGSPPSLDLTSSSPPSRFLDFDFDSLPLCSSPTTNDTGDKHAEDFAQMVRWFTGQNEDEQLSGIDPSKMHLSSTIDDQTDAMLW